MGHKHWRLEQCIGKRVKIVFKDGNWCEGTLAHKPNEWRYGMNGCDWHSATDHEKDHHIFGWLLFCHSNVRVIQEQEDGKIETVEAIPKDQYETRLKADLIAILTDIKLKITEKSFYYIRIFGKPLEEKEVDLVELDDVNDIIQEKINTLRGRENECI